MHVALAHLRVPQALFHRLHALAEEVHAELLKAGARDRAVEVDALVERVNLNARLRGRGERALGALARGAQPPARPCILADVLLELALELCLEVRDEAVVEVFTAEVSVTGCGLDLKDAVLDGQ